MDALAAASADCPALTLAIGGKTDTELTALAQDIQDYSDGLNATLTFGFDATFWTNFFAATSMSAALGNAATASTAANGAYAFGLTFLPATDTVTNIDITGDMVAVYLASATVTSD